MIALTGYLGAGKTTLLNHVLRSPDARIGVVINDFGELNVDAGLVTGQIDEPASIAGGCICCLPDEGGLDVALARLADPRLKLDAIIVEASGLADPVAVSRIIRFSGVDGIRPGGVVDVLDAATHFDTVDRDATPPARYAAATLVVVNKLDQIPEGDRAEALERIEGRVRELNPHAYIVGVTAGRVDPALLYDVAGDADHVGQLTFRELWSDAGTAPQDHDHDHDTTHADSVTVTTQGCVDPGAVIDLLEEPPAGVYRMKGTIARALPDLHPHLQRQRRGADGPRRGRAVDRGGQQSRRDRDGPGHRGGAGPDERGADAGTGRRPGAGCTATPALPQAEHLTRRY